MPGRSPLHRQLDAMLAALGGTDDAARRLAVHLVAWGAEQLAARYGFTAARAAMLHAFDIARDEQTAGVMTDTELHDATPAGRA